MVVFLAIAGAIWFVLIRPVPVQNSRGRVLSKSYKPPGVYMQHHAGTRQGFRVPTKIPIAEGYVIEIEVDDSNQVVSTLLNQVEARQYEIGTKVKFEYFERSVPFLWRRVFVQKVIPEIDQ